MRKMNITTRVETFVGRTAAPLETHAAKQRPAPFDVDFAAPQERGTGRPASPLTLVATQEDGTAKSPELVATRRKRSRQVNPMPWCKHPAASGFGRLCTDQLKAYKVKTTGA